MNNVRALFQIPDDISYFNLAGISPLLKTVRNAGENAVSRKSSPWLMTPETFFHETEIARGLFARLIGAEAGDIALIPSASYGMATALLNLKLKAGDEIIVQAEEFPSVYLPLEKFCRQHEAKCIVVARPPDGNWTPAVIAAINSKTRALALSPAHWTDGSVVDTVKVGACARDVDAMLILDGCQSIGAVLFDVKNTKPDFLIVPTYKWLMGPYSYGFLYVSPRFQSGNPLEENWVSRKGAENFLTLGAYEPHYQAGARRFDMGERSNPIALPMTIAALEQLLTWRPEWISERLAQITDEIATCAASKGYTVHPKPNRSPHFLGLRRHGKITPELVDQFSAQKIYLSLRGDCLRIAPHLHNTRADLERLFAAL